MQKLASILICCFITGTLCGCGSEGGCSSSSDGGCGSMGSHDGGSNLNYETVPLPSAALPIGIMDSPYYDCQSRSLYFVDLFGSKMFRYSEDLNQIFYCTIPGQAQPSFIKAVKGQQGTYMVGLNQSVYSVQWDGVSTVCNIINTITTAEQGTDHHTNAAVAGPRGALYFGYFARRLCGQASENGLYRWTRKGGLERLPGEYKTTNSMTYDYHKNIVYHLDGCTQKVRAAKVNKKTGKMSPFRIVFDQFCLPQTVAPVGISVTRNGDLMIGSYLGGKLFRIDPSTSEIKKTWTMPTKYMGASTYGGCNFDRFYVLTAQLEANILNGSVISTGAPAPAGSLLIFHGLGRGQGERKPCLGGCSN